MSTHARARTFLFRPLCFRVALQELFTVLAVAKRLCAARAARRETGADIAVIKAFLKTGSTNELMQEASVETVARPDRIDRLNRERS